MERSGDASIRGMGILQVVIAAAIGSVILLGLTQGLRGLSKSQNAIITSGDFELAIDNVRSVVGKRTFCKKAFRHNANGTGLLSYTPPSTLPTPPAFYSVEIDRILLDTPGIVKTAVITRNQKLANGLQIDDIEWRSTGVASSDAGGGKRRHYVTLHIQAKRDHSSTAGGQYLQKDINMSLVTDAGGKVIECYSVGSGGLEVAIAKRESTSTTNFMARPFTSASVVRGPASAFIALDNDLTTTDPISGTPTAKDGIACNEAEGWVLSGCWIANNLDPISAGTGDPQDSDVDVNPTGTGCMTNDFRQGQFYAWLTVNCMRTSE